MEVVKVWCGQEWSDQEGSRYEWRQQGWTELLTVPGHQSKITVSQTVLI